MKQIWGFFCALLLAAGSLFPSGFAAVEFTNGSQAGREAGERPAGADLSLYASAAVLLDADTGRVLYGKEADTPLPMASTTKILTCILVLENASPDETVEVSACAASMPKVKLYIKKGERYTVRDLLYSLMLESHNDSAAALAEHVGKRLSGARLADKGAGEFTPEESRQAVAAFAGLMNEKAVELGCKDSWFITPNGLDATQEFTLADGTVIQRSHSATAAELARIMAYCIGRSPKSGEFLEITRRAVYSFSANGRSFSCRNHNAFLNMMDGAVSGKTGFTNKAGYCYVGALRRDGRTFVVALLACGWPNHRTWKWSDTRELMRYGLENYFYRGFDEEGTAFDEGLLKPVPVRNGQPGRLGRTAYTDLMVAEPAGAEREGESSGEERAQAREASGQESGPEAADFQLQGMLLRKDEEIRVEYDWEETLTAPVERGTQVGEIRYIVDGTVYRRDRIITADYVPAIRFDWCFRQILRRFVIN